MPKQTITSLTVNVERCFKRVEDAEKTLEALKSMTESTNKLVLDLDRKVADAMHIASMAETKRHREIVEPAADKFDRLRRSIEAKTSPAITRYTVKFFNNRLALVLDAKTIGRSIECTGWTHRDGMTEFYNQSTIILSVPTCNLVLIEEDD